MQPIAFHLGSMPVHWYGILVALGFLAGFWTASRRAALDGLAPQAVADIGPWLIAGGLLGARGLYVLTFWETEFASEPWTHVFNIRQGGLIFYGGFIGAVLLGMVYLRKHRLPTLKVGDALAPSIALGHAFGRLGCLMTGCCYGKTCELPWAISFPRDHITHPHPVHPTQIYESAFNFLLYGALAWAYRRKRFDGQIFAIYLLAYAILRAFNEHFRGDYDAAQKWGFLTPGQATGILIFGVGMTLYYVSRGLTPARSSTSNP
ncbi:MAG: prolipoprotein diacylglyceryl transferase [Limisphaerales bacterium]|nr:prolipoprotein diacylglyceryl transferase [Verrucomicrobiota bacterium]